MDQERKFDQKLACGCARAYAESTGLGCTLSDADGRVLCQYGNGCAVCRVCAIAGVDRRRAEESHLYGMSAAARFGGKYVYFCPMGLTCFVSPILDAGGRVAQMTVGPFLMVEQEDYIALDLEEKLRLSPETIRRVTVALESVPYVEPHRVRALSELLFYAVSFLGDVTAAGAMLDQQDSGSLQGTLSGYITELKSTETSPDYPLLTEKQLTAAIASADKPEAGKLLNELLGYIFFTSGGDLSRIKARVYELIVLISRAATDGGADARETFEMNERYFREIQRLGTVDELCFWLTEVMNAYLDRVFRYADVRHYDMIHKAVAYIREHLTGKITLEDVAREVYLTPSYLSRTFKREMGCNFSRYLNRLRVERSKPLLLNETIRLADVAQLVGFEDQSYFTKVFKRVTGVPPSAFRDARGRLRAKSTGDDQEIHAFEDKNVP